MFPPGFFSRTWVIARKEIEWFNEKLLHVLAPIIAEGAALTTVVGVLIEVPVTLMLVKFCLNTREWFN